MKLSFNIMGIAVSWFILSLSALLLLVHCMSKPQLALARVRIRAGTISITKES